MTTRIAFISANLGKIDPYLQDMHVKQVLPKGIKLDFFYFDETNFPLRDSAMLPRLQAKIPKMTGWDLVPGYDIYIWADAVITLSSNNAVKWMFDKLGNADIALFRHQDNRTSIAEELSFMQNHMSGATGNDFAEEYLNSRYKTEPMKEQVTKYLLDQEFSDDSLYSAGLFIYRNTNKMQIAMLDWLLHNVLYSVQDQLSLPYILQKHRCVVNTIDAEIVNNEITEYYWRNRSNSHKWDNAYKSIPSEPSPWIYGDTETYKLGAEFLQDCSTVEDWGTGAGGFKAYRKDAIGVDGSVTPYADKIADLADYQSTAEGIFMRHVLEHNWDWKKILCNALDSATKKLAIIVFTPMSDRGTFELKEGTEMNVSYGIDVPNLSLSMNTMIFLIKSKAKSVTTKQLLTQTHYGTELMFLINK